MGYIVQVLVETWANGTEIWADYYPNLSLEGAKKYAPIAHELSGEKPVRIVAAMVRIVTAIMTE